jgi:WD40 repeat protein
LVIDTSILTIQSEAIYSENKLNNYTNRSIPSKDTPSIVDTVDQTSSFSNNFANLTGHGWRVREVAFSPNAPIIATGSSDGTIRLWDLNTGEVLKILSGHHYGIIALDFSPSGEILASGGYDNKINLWDVATGEKLDTWSNYPHAVIDLKWSPDGKTLAVGGGEWMGIRSDWNQPNKYLQLFDVTSGKVIKQFVGHSKPVFSIAFSNNGSFLISGSWDSSVRLWDVTLGTEIRSFTNHSDRITSVAFSHNESTIISGGLDQTIKFWNINSVDVSYEIEINQSIWSLALSPKDDILAVAVDPDIRWPDTYWLTFGVAHDCSIQLWNVSTGELIDTLSGHRNSIESVKFSPDGTILASASWDWTVKLWGDRSPLLIEEPINNWPTASLEEEGINATILNRHIKTIQGQNFHSVLIIRNGKLVFEQYYDDPIYNEFTPKLKHTLFSATKSFTSALIGIAIDKGFIESTDQLVLDFFPEKNIDTTDSRKNAITIHHLLSMTTGLEHDEYEDIWGIAIANDSVEHILSKPLYADPGTVYQYNTGSSHILSAIIQKVTGNSTRDFAMKYLFGPLGIEETDVSWVAGSDSVFCGGIGLFLTPRNMAKFGQLYLNKGKWNENQIISSDWIKISSKDHIKEVSKNGWMDTSQYGYHFWIDENKYYALGWGGQTIQIIPDYDLVIVTTALGEASSPQDFSNRVINSLFPGSSNKSPLLENSKLPAFSIYIASLIFIQVLRRKKKYLNRSTLSKRD